MSADMAIRTAPSKQSLASIDARPSSQPHTPTSTLASLYVVSGLPKSPHTWNLADSDTTLGVHHSEGAVGRFWRAEVLGHTVSAGVGGKKKKRGGGTDIKGAGALGKSDIGKMLSKTLKLSFTREVEIIASTLQPTSTIHSFTFTTNATPSNSSLAVRNSLVSADNRISAYSTPSTAYGTGPDPFAPPTASNSYLGVPPSSTRNANNENKETTTWHGVCLTVWSHADAERSTAIRRALEATNGTRGRKESAHSVTSTKLKALRAERKRRGSNFNLNNPGNANDIATEGETDGEGISDSEYDAVSVNRPGGSTLFLPGDTVFWLPYALTLVSRHPIYDLLRDYLTLSWARFSKDVAAHTLQISKILACPAPRAGDIVRLDASASNNSGDGDAGSLEIVARFPGGLDFGKGLVDINFTMWPFFKALSLDNILNVCEVALAPTGRVLFLSRYPAMLSTAVLSLKYLAELRGWNGIAHPNAHCRDAKIYVDDPGPWIIGLSTESRYSVRPSPEVCICDLDINYVNCPAPPAYSLSIKHQRERFKQQLVSAFDSYYSADYLIPSEFKEAFPAGRFRPLCKIQAKRGVSNAAASVISEAIKAPEWWNGPKVLQTLDVILTEKMKRPSFLKRLTRTGKMPPRLTVAEQAIQLSIRKRAAAFVDARDDLETKIGRLSRRLNFLVTESDLWREKFITFEQYAEKLSTEATDLRVKINREQRESKRLSGMISATAHEKIRLESKLRETEDAHTQATVELEKLRDDMERMEEERELMVAEVEAQIERALASMLVDDEDNVIYRSQSRPTSRSSRIASPIAARSRSAPGSRRHSFSAVDSGLPTVRDSFATVDTILAEHAQREKRSMAEEAIEEEMSDRPKEEKPRTELSKKKSKHFDDIDPLDAGISEKSDRIAQKVLQIQQKLEMALQSDASRSTHSGSESEATSNKTASSRRRRAPLRVQSPTARPAEHVRSLSPTPESPVTESTEQPPTPTLTSTLTPSTTASSMTMQPRTPPGGSVHTTDVDSDLEFQSAISHSPTTSRNSLDDANAIVGQAYSPGLDGHSFSHVERLHIPGDIETNKLSTRPRMPSNATARRVSLNK